MQRRRGLVLGGIIAVVLYGCGGGSTGSAPAALNKTTTSGCSRLLPGPPRGLACLHCSQPQAQPQAVELRTLMINSCLQNIAVNYLIDDTFQYDEEFLKDEISHLSQDERSLTVVLYLTNGPAQRSVYRDEAGVFGADLTPEEFRTRIRTDEGLRAEYVQLVQSRVPLIAHAAKHAARAIVIPALEDNLDLPAFEALLALTQAAIPQDLPVRFGRSPCAHECYPGNDDLIPTGVVEEAHTAETELEVTGGIITNDGRSYEGTAALTTLDQLRLVRDRAGSLDNIFILWSASRQGLDPNAAGLLIPAAERNFLVPSDEERAELIDFLQEGLE